VRGVFFRALTDDLVVGDLVDLARDGERAAGR